MKKLNSSNTLELLENDTTSDHPKPAPTATAGPGSPGAGSCARQMERGSEYRAPEHVWQVLPAQDQKGIAESTAKYEPFYKPGFLGNYFVNSMLPDKNGMIKNKMKAFKNHIPPADLG